MKNTLIIRSVNLPHEMNLHEAKIMLRPSHYTLAEKWVQEKFFKMVISCFSQWFRACPSDLEGVYELWMFVSTTRFLCVAFLLWFLLSTERCSLCSFVESAIGRWELLFWIHPPPTPPPPPAHPTLHWHVKIPVSLPHFRPARFDPGRRPPLPSTAILNPQENCQFTLFTCTLGTTRVSPHAFFCMFKPPTFLFVLVRRVLWRLNIPGYVTAVILCDEALLLLPPIILSTKWS